ncbi:MAG TPA: ATP-binding protein [Nitrospiraceae bacterium]|nr:ATP-binding protein [Nitrospiraceae bacterium]
MMATETRPSVLVVDDEPQILTSIQDLLEDKFTVSATVDTRRALTHLEQGEFAVVLSDQRMPGLSGDEFLGRVSEISGATRVLITGYADMEGLVRAVNRGQIYAYVAKPWDPADLRMKITQAAEHYRLQVQLVHEQNLLHALMDNVPDAIYFKDKDCRYTRLNKAKGRLLGLERPEDAVGKTLCDFYSEEWAREALQDEERIVRTGLPILDKEEQILRPGGQLVWVSSTKVPIRSRDKGVAGIVGISRDVTERRQAVEKLARQAEELARYNAELERFAYISAHDLQEPLRTVTSFTQLLAQRYQGKHDADADRFTQLVVAGCARMKQLIDDLLTYSRIARRAPEFAPTDCQSVYQRSLENLHAAVQESGARVTCDPLPAVVGDESRLGQLFTNLIGNAIKFRGQSPPQVHVSARQRDSEWVFSVHDNGIGIDPAHAEQIFEIFQRLHGKDEYPGTGLGLAVCKKIVESHGGRIWVESEPGRGATFCFTIPL